MSASSDEIRHLLTEYVTRFHCSCKHPQCRKCRLAARAEALGITPDRPFWNLRPLIEP